MDLNFISDPNLVPKPRDQVRLQRLQLVPYADQTRVRVEIEITPFHPSERPNIELVARKDDGTQVAALNIVETMHHRISLTVHLRQSGPLDGVYTFTANLFYGDDPIQHSLEAAITLPDDALAVDQEAH